MVEAEYGFWLYGSFKYYDKYHSQLGGDEGGEGRRG